MFTGIGPEHELRGLAVPVQPRPFRLTVGTRPTQRWLLPGPDGPAQLAAKRRLLDDHPDEVLAVLPHAEAAVTLLARMVADAVTPAAGGPRGQGRRTGQGVERGEAVALLRATALTVQEDLTLMQRDDAGTWRLVAGCVCFPSFWRLGDKIGQDLDAIHTPVPHYSDRLAAASRMAFDRIATGGGQGIWERFNWTLTADDDLFHPDPKPPVQVSPDEVPRRVWLRTERQSMRAMADSRTVVFGIRTFLTSLGELTPVEREALACSLPGVSPELTRYRAALGYRDAVQEWLRRREPV